MDRHASRWAANSQLAILAVTLGLVALPGCGSNSQVAESTNAVKQPSSAQQSGNAASTTNSPSASDVVSQFLDEFRRGGTDSRANLLLTERARQELARIGLTVEPIGTPDAKFVVTRAEPVPDEPNSMFVHSILSEPTPDGGVTKSQVVWAVEREPIGWRISGFAMEIEQGADPIIVDFENSDLMAQLMGNPRQNTNSEQARAPAANGSAALSR